MTTKYIIESPWSKGKRIQFITGFESFTNNVFLAKCFDTKLGAGEYMRKVKFEQMGLDRDTFKVVGIYVGGDL